VKRRRGQRRRSVHDRKPQHGKLKRQRGQKPKRVCVRYASVCERWELNQTMRCDDSLWRSMTAVNPLIIETVVRDLAIAGDNGARRKEISPPHLESIFPT
jgi:hypothetical protein